MKPDMSDNLQFADFRTERPVRMNRIDLSVD